MRQFTQRRLRYIWRYFRGNTPWNSGIVPPEITAWVQAFEDAGRTPGRALDLGCGTGTSSLFLAERGWDVVGVDYVPQAIRQARLKAANAAPAGSVRFVVGDVSRGDLLAREAPFDLLIDVGCLHSLDADQQAGYAHMLMRNAAPGASFLLYAFLPRSTNGSTGVGVDQTRLETLLGAAFEVVDCVKGIEVTTPVPSAWYTLRCKEPVS